MKKLIGIQPTKKQQKDFEKFISSKTFFKRLLVLQWSAKEDFKILNFNSDKTCWFVIMSNQYFLYNEKNNILLFYGELFNENNPPKITSSKNIPWSEIETKTTKTTKKSK